MKTFATCCVLVLTSGVLFAQEKGTDGKQNQKQSKEERVKALQEQLAKVQRELAKEGVAPLPATLLPPYGGAGAAAFGSAGGGFAVGGFADPPRHAGLQELDKQIAAHEVKLEALIDKHGKDSPEVQRAEEELSQLKRSRAFAAAGPGTPSGFGALTGQGGPGADSLRQYARMMLQTGGQSEPPGFGSVADPAEMGQQMVISGLEIQLQSMAAQIHETKDEETSESLTKELREMVELVAEVRGKLQKRRIERLEKTLAQLKNDAEKDESVEETVERLLKHKP